MKTPEQLKGTIRSMAAKRNLRAQEVLQMFLFERILERLANSKYKKNFILKGGLLISSMIGISERTTMDMDIPATSECPPEPCTHRRGSGFPPGAGKAATPGRFPARQTSFHIEPCSVLRWSSCVTSVLT